MDMKHLTGIALETAKAKGASYADIRIINLETENIYIRNGRISNMDHNNSFGFGVRVLANGAWGFASSAVVSQAEIGRISAVAVEIAHLAK